MTKVLLITNKTDLTTDFIVLKLRNLEIEFYRFNTEDIGNTILVTLDFQQERYLIFDTLQNKEYKLLEFSAVYYRRPEIGVYDEGLSAAESLFIKSETTYLLEGLYSILQKKRWLNNVYAIRQAENKLYQIQLAKQLGFNVPNSIVSNNVDHLRTFFDVNDQDCIIKPIKSGLVHYDSDEEGVVFTSKIDEVQMVEDKIKKCPAYLQRLVQKQGDVRVTVVEGQIFAALIHSQDHEQTKVDWRKGEMHLTHTSISLPGHIEDKCLSLLKALHLNFGAIDLILDSKNDFIFLEINPNGQWAWIERQLKSPISETIVNYLIK